MDVKIAKTAGFCWGVRRTVDKVMEVADHRRGPVVTLGPIIHNPQAVARFREKGVGTVNAVADVSDGTTVVVRTHGAIREEIETAEARGLHVVIVGDANHAEIKGVLSYVQGGCTVVKPGGAIPEIDAKKVAVIAQTTCIGAEFERVVGALAGRHKEVGAVVVVGGKNSANTRHLADICREIQPRTWHVETEDELRAEWFEGCRAVGLSAGASTPDWVVEGVAGWLRALP